MRHTYDIPNVGCLLGIAYQSELAKLSNTLTAAGLDITAAEYLVLRVLSSGSVQKCEITRILRKDKASVNRNVQALAKKGYVAVESLSHKCCMVSLTDAGSSLMPRLMEVAATIHGELANKISREQMECLRDILEKIIE